MESSPTDVRKSNDRLVLLVEQQKQVKEGSSAWYSIQAQINQIIADRYLEMLNS